MKSLTATTTFYYCLKLCTPTTQAHIYMKSLPFSGGSSSYLRSCLVHGTNASPLVPSSPVEKGGNKLMNLLGKGVGFVPSSPENGRKKLMDLLGEGFVPSSPVETGSSTRQTPPPTPPSLGETGFLSALQYHRDGVLTEELKAKCDVAWRGWFILYILYINIYINTHTYSNKY